MDRRRRDYADYSYEDYEYEYQTRGKSYDNRAPQPRYHESRGGRNDYSSRLQEIQDPRYERYNPQNRAVSTPHAVPHTNRQFKLLPSDLNVNILPKTILKPQEFSQVARKRGICYNLSMNQMIGLSALITMGVIAILTVLIGGPVGGVAARIECGSSPCGNNGRCTDGFNLYVCTCLNGFSGTNCENAPPTTTAAPTTPPPTTTPAPITTTASNATNATTATTAAPVPP